MIFDRYVMECRRSELGLRRLEAHYGKEAVCEPSCTHSPSELLCSRHSSRTSAPLTIGRDHAGEGSDA